MEEDVHVIGMVIHHKNGEKFLVSVYDGCEDADSRFLAIVREVVMPTKGRYTLFDEFVNNWTVINIEDIKDVDMLTDDDYLRLMLGGADDE